MRGDALKVAGKRFKSRLIVGTGKYKNFSETAKAVQAQEQIWLQSQLEE